MDEHTPHIIPALERATHAVALWSDTALRHLGVSQAEAHVLAALAGTSTCSINDLHRSFGHKRSTLTSILDRLERRGLVRRGAHPTSRRLVLVTLTDAGHPVAAEVATALHDLESRIAVLASPADRDAFRRVLRAIETATAVQAAHTQKPEEIP
jgi:DNA-binding MarR family transcriptional regulator